MNVDGLKLNDDKTEFTIIGSRQQLEKVSVAELSVGDISVVPASCCTKSWSSVRSKSEV